MITLPTNWSWNGLEQGRSWNENNQHTRFACDGGSFPQYLVHQMKSSGCTTTPLWTQFLKALVRAERLPPLKKQKRRRRAYKIGKKEGLFLSERWWKIAVELFLNRSNPFFQKKCFCIELVLYIHCLLAWRNSPTKQSMFLA